MSIVGRLKDAMAREIVVQLRFGDENRQGFVIALGPDLVLIQAVHDWHNAGALIVPIAAIESCETSDLIEDQMKILQFNSVKRTRSYGWVRLDSWGELFRSLTPKGRFAVLSFGDEAEVGRVDAVNSDSVDLRVIDPGGNWVEDIIECAFDDITMVEFDDNYSRVLQRYAERAPVTN